MKIKQFQIDAFTDRVFGGNPAAVCPLQSWAEDNLFQSIKDKGGSVDYLGDIFFKILEKNTPTFRQEDIVSIVEFLYTKKKKTEADHICNTYAERGKDFLKSIYENHNK